MPCYRCGTRQVDPEPGKGSPWRQGVVRWKVVNPIPEARDIADYQKALAALG